MGQGVRLNANTNATPKEYKGCFLFSLACTCTGRSQMAKLVVLLLSLLCRLASHAVDAQYYWSPATATFYGGSDGSGTMGLFLFPLQFYTFICSEKKL